MVVQDQSAVPVQGHQESHQVDDLNKGQAPRVAASGRENTEGGTNADMSAIPENGLPPCLNVSVSGSGNSAEVPDAGVASISSSATPPDMDRLSERLRKTALKIQSTFIAADGKAVDYAGLADSAVYKELQHLARQLSGTEARVVPEDVTERKAFFINLYNVLMMHGVIANKIQTGGKHPIEEAKASGRPVTFFGDAAYLIEGLRMSLDDIEHGVLRGNTPRPGQEVGIFRTGDDPRKKWMISGAVDGRIHFTLVCGAKGCPAIQVYTAQNLERGLTGATKAFLNAETEVTSSPDTNTIEVQASMLFNWYGPDFGSSELDRLKFISSYLSGEKGDILAKAGEAELKLSFKPYDWGLNSK